MKCPAQLRNSNAVQLTIANPVVANSYDMVLSARLLSKWRTAIAVPEHLGWGQLNHNAGDEFFLVEIQKKTKVGFKEMLLDAKIDNLPFGDIDSLYQGDSLVDNGFSIDRLTRYEKGSYRARVLCKLSAFNPGMKDIYSNWVYFRYVKD
jgi:hypothetical protein